MQRIKQANPQQAKFSRCKSIPGWAVVAPTPAATALTSVMAAVVMTPVLAVPIFRSILQLASCNGATNHTEDRMAAHLLSGISTSHPASNGAHDTSLAFRGVGVIGRIGVLGCHACGINVASLLVVVRGLARETLLLLSILFCWRPVAASRVLRWWRAVVCWLTLGVASIVLPILAPLLAVLKASLLRRAVRVRSLRWAVALRCFAVLRCWGRIALLTVSLWRALLVALSVVWRILVVWV